MTLTHKFAHLDAFVGVLISSSYFLETLNTNKRTGANHLNVSKTPIIFYAFVGVPIPSSHFFETLNTNKRTRANHVMCQKTPIIFSTVIK